MADGPLVTPGANGFGRAITREELEDNVSTYVQWIQRSGIPADVSVIVILAPRGSGEAMGVTGLVNCEPEAAQKVLEHAAKRIKRNRIVRPA